MRLFKDDKAEKSKANTETSAFQSGVTIISSRSKVLDDINSSLLMYEMDDTENIFQSFLSISDITVTQDSGFVIADIENCTDLNSIQQAIALLIPAHARCILLGDVDSIIFSREVNKLGAIYLHIASQLGELPEIILEQPNNLLMRGSIIFSVLGCKGGSGTSSFCYDLIKTTGEENNIPILMVQGAAGSLDLDLLLGRAIPRDGTILPLDKNISVKMEQIDHSWQYQDQNFNRFNVIFIDNPIYNCPQERLDYITKYSHSILLLITRDLSSLRIAKSVVDYIGRISANISLTPRIFICLNNCRPPVKNDLTNEDIEEYINKKIDIIQPYQPTVRKNNSVEMQRFSAILLGKKVLSAPVPPKKLLATIFNRKIKP